MDSTDNEIDNKSTENNWNDNDDNDDNDDIELDADAQSTNNNFDVMFMGPKTSLPTATHDNSQQYKTNNNSKQFSTCRTLQRKLELKVERAKRNYSQYNQKNANKNEEIRVSTSSASSNLIPISRLQIPGIQESVPLVEYRSENSEEDEVISTFFLTKSKSNKKIDLSDTFSIQEMTIESDSGEESGDSQNLELLPPATRIQFLDRIISYLCCSNSEI